MWQTKRIVRVLVFLIALKFYRIDGCQMEGVSNWSHVLQIQILDTYRGSILSRTTTDITGINNIAYSTDPPLNGGPYIDTTLSDSVFTITTNNLYPNYEENETQQAITMTVEFGCLSGSTNRLVILINIIDTNNNAPQFIPTNEFEFTILPPVPPGFIITDCLSGIFVRDIDLTTQRIDFAIDDNPYIAIEESIDATPKQFQAILKTTTLIRSLPEPIEVRISATDVDLTSDPPHTTYATIRVLADNSFIFPEEPVFSETMYFVNYTTNNELIQLSSIFLSQGYDDDVQFALDPTKDYANYFVISTNENQVLLSLVSPLPPAALLENQIYLVILASREHTSGAAATVIVEMPTVVAVEFEDSHYRGTIENNNLFLPDLILRQGYENAVEITLAGEYSSLFTYNRQENTITISMSALPANFIEDNSLIDLLVTVSTERSTAAAVVILEIIKDDNETPVFEKALYEGAYDTNSGLSLEPIQLIQGFDNDASVFFTGVYSSYFILTRNNSILELDLISSLPIQLLSEQHQLLLTVQATKLRTVGANTTISIALPTLEALEFEETLYKGTIENNLLQLENLIINTGYEENITVSILGEHSSYFNSVIQNNIITVTMAQLDESVIEQSSVINLQVVATGDWSTAFAIASLEVIKDDTTTPMFEKNIYEGEYNVFTGLVLEPIRLVQGYDNSVSLSLVGEYSEYFIISQTDSSTEVSILEPLPISLLREEQQIVLSIIATKSRTVGAHSTIFIKLPENEEIEFEQTFYTGQIIDNSLQLGNIFLRRDYEDDITISISGTHSSAFNSIFEGNQITLTMASLEENIIQNNNFLTIVVQAASTWSVATTIVTLEIIKDDTITPVFERNIYEGSYESTTGLAIDSLSLIQGFDSTVSLSLRGEYSQYFTLVQSNSVFEISTISLLPPEVTDRDQLLLTVQAMKPRTVGAHATIFIDLPKELTIIQFDQRSYSGFLQNSELNLPQLMLAEDYGPLNLIISGDYADYFEIYQESRAIVIETRDDLPPNVSEDNAFIVLDIEASQEDAISGFVTIILELVKEPIIETPVFEQAFYIGEYSRRDSLIFTQSIQLIQGFTELVNFTLEGDDSQWFILSENGNNNVTLSLADDLISDIPEKVKLVFSVVANKPNSVPGKSAVIITLQDNINNEVLRFEKNNYIGVIENNMSRLELITLNETYTGEVQFSLQGDFVNYFEVFVQDGMVNISLVRPIPEEIILSSDIIVLELIASSSNTLSAYATIIFNIAREISEVEELEFSNTYYTGRYMEADQSVTLDEIISLNSGYDATIEFHLEGESAQWFGIERTENVLSLVITSPIPQLILDDNQQLVFVIRAQNENIVTRATIVIAVINDLNDRTILGFERVSYLGSIENDIANLESIVLTEGFSTDVTFSLQGDLSQYFTITAQGATVSVAVLNSIPDELLPSNSIIVLELVASAPNAISAYATVVLEVISEIETPTVDQLLFGSPFYTGSYSSVSESVTLDNVISLSAGYDATVAFSLEGVSSQWFAIQRTENSISLIVTSPIPQPILANNQQLVFVINAQKEGSLSASATIVISLTDDLSDATILGFERVSYLGSIENDIANLESIVLTEGFSTNVTFSLQGDLSQYFTITAQGATVSVAVLNSIPDELLPSNSIIVLELVASAPNAISAYATVVLEVINVTETPIVDQLLFSSPFYTGRYSSTNESVTLNGVISLTAGYDATVAFSLEGESSQWFDIERNENSVLLVVTTPIPLPILANNQQLIFVINAQNEEGLIARATIVISLLIDNSNTIILNFERVNYLGAIENDIITLESIVLTEGYTTDVSFVLQGELSQYFTLTAQGPSVSLVLLNLVPEELLHSNSIIVLNIVASAPNAIPAYTTIVLEVVSANETPELGELMFDSPYYIGQYYADNATVTLDAVISLSAGYDTTVVFNLEGDSSQWFAIERTENLISLSVTNPIPQPIVANNQQLVFVISAQKDFNLVTRSIIVIALINNGLTPVPSLEFDKLLYTGSIQEDIVAHEQIFLSGVPEETITIIGDLSEFFSTYYENNEVFVIKIDSTTVPNDVSHIALELRVSEASAILLLDVENTVVDPPNMPNVIFNSESYTVQIDITRTGQIGKVLAVADNEESVNYSLLIDNAHLTQRLSINNDGDIYLSAPANIGVYTFEVLATTIFTQATATASVHLVVEAVTICGAENDIVVPPLLVIDRDEEEAHENLVPLNNIDLNCEYILNNRWPVDQTWLYVDENGLHTTAIDREHSSIAYMALSQIQVELLLQCDHDTSRTKRSLESKARPDWLGSYDYGPYEWVLTDTIQYNPRRTLVNLVINDINDNAPIFIGKNEEPITIGYPIPDLTESVLPRALVQLQATDADIGINAALVYWSSEPVLSVSSFTGFVHVREGAILEDEQLVIVNATDQNGIGLTGSIQLQVRILDLRHISVVTVRNAFLDDEPSILANLSSAVGYDVKVLSSVVIPDDEIQQRMKYRTKKNNEVTGTSLRLFVYGITEQREPVLVQNLNNDLSTNVPGIDISNILTLEQHIEDRETVTVYQQNVGLLVSTILLSVLLFILLIVIALWFFLKWKKKQRYNEFSDDSSVTSQTGTLERPPKLDTLNRPRMNIEDLKESEKRLRKRLETPEEQTSSSQSAESPVQVILNKSSDVSAPVVIQSIDKLKNSGESEDEDEYGERRNQKPVVTFNENVEKIIHVEDNPDLEIYKL